MSTAASPTKYQYVTDRYGPDPFTCTKDEFLAMVAELVRDNPTDWAMPDLREAPDGSLREFVDGMWETVLVPVADDGEPDVAAGKRGELWCGGGTDAYGVD